MGKFKYTRGKAIFEEYKNRLESPDISDEERAYYRDIIFAVEDNSYDNPIPLNKMYKALEQAEKQVKKIHIVADDEFLEGGICSGQYDGWTYHIELK